MGISYLAYGLELDSSFALAGLGRGADPTLPSLALALAPTEQVTDGFSGDGALPAWRGRLGDGGALEIERGRAGDVLFTHLDPARPLGCARYLLDRRRRRLLCAPGARPRDWEQVLTGKVLCNVSLLRGYEALHASAVDGPDGVVAIAGPSGAGKSTLAGELGVRGFRAFAEDVLTLGRDATTLRAYPSASRASPRPVRLVCLLERRPGLALHGRVLPASPVPLAPHMLGFGGDRARQRERFELFSELARHATLMRIEAPPDAPPGALAELIERELEGGGRGARRPARVRGTTPPDHALEHPPLELSSISKRWRGHQAPVLDGVSLRLGAGTSTWVGGRNGVGKTTLLRIAAGLIDADAGRVEARGVTAREARRRYQRLVSLLAAGDRGLYARITVREHLAFAARIAMLPRARLRGAVDGALEEFALGELADRRVDRMSMGQRQRLRLALAFLATPDVALLDEPLTSLDDEGAALLRGALAKLRARGGAVLWCSPRPEPLGGPFDAAWTLEAGKLTPRIAVTGGVA